MACGKILNVMSTKPAKMQGKTFTYKYNPKNETYVKFEKTNNKK